MKAQFSFVVDIDVHFELIQIDSDRIFAFFRHDFWSVTLIAVYVPSHVFAVKAKSLTVRTVR
jgi:hypothetical protein